MELILENKSVELKKLDKLYFERENISKGEVIDYYIKFAPLILPHLFDRPFSMIFFPDGKPENSFYQKQAPSYAPDWLKTVSIPSERRGHINWCMINDLPSLIYLVNKSVLEMHAWFSRRTDLRKPDMAVMDLDPSGNTGIGEAVVIANAFRDILTELNIYSVPKTSGSRGIHIFIPIKKKYDFAEVQEFLKFICRAVMAKYPALCTTERTVKKRGDKIYLDAVQCGYGKTLAMPYSLRVKSGALVSTPLKWEEVNADLDPKKFNIRTMDKRIEDVGNLMGDFYSRAQSLPVLH